MVLFLDYDGVLHPDSVYLIKRRPTLKGEGTLFMWADILNDILIDFPEVKLVLSTSWCRELSFNRARRYLPDSLKRRVIGSTWHSAMKKDGFTGEFEGKNWWDQAGRYQQILRFVNRAGLSNWIAIDDQPEGWQDPDLNKLVKTDSKIGISDIDCQNQLRDLLLKNSTFLK